PPLGPGRHGPQRLVPRGAAAVAALQAHPPARPARRRRLRRLQRLLRRRRPRDRHVIMRRLLPLLLLGLLPAAARADTPAEAPVEAAAAEARRAQLYARVGEARITVGDIEDALAEATTFRPERFAEPGRLEAFAQQLVDRTVLAQAAERQ